MNRAFKRLRQPAKQGGIFNTSDTMLKFTFEGKTYTALEGDSIKMALIVNNITHYHRSISGYFLSSAAGLYPVTTNITYNHLYNHIIASDDFKITHGLKLSQTNKPNFASKLRAIGRFFKASTGIHRATLPITAKNITDSIIDDRLASKQVSAFTEKMRFDTEKSYIHTDIAIIGTNIFALQAALILADSGVRVMICNTYTDIAYTIFQDSDVQSLFNDLQNRTKNHNNITFKDMVDISLVCNDNSDNIKTTQIMGINHLYSFDNTATLTNKQSHTVTVSVINAKHILYAPCLKEMGFLFQGHHLPNILSCREFMDLHLKFSLVANQNIVLYVANDMAYDILNTAGITPNNVNAIIDIRPTMTQTMINAEKAGFKIYAGYVVTHATGKEHIKSVTFKSLRGDKDAVTKSVSCHVLLCSSGYGLDISLLDNIPHSIDVNVSDDCTIAPCVDSDFLNKNNISLCGYAFHNPDNIPQNKQSVFGVCTQILQALNIKTQLSENPDIAQILDRLTWHYPTNYDAHDLCRKEAVLFPQDIHYNDFIQVLHRYDKPVCVIEALGQAHNFYGNHRAICILMTQMHKIYNLSPADIKRFYNDILIALNKQISSISTSQILAKILTCGQPKPHILPCLESTKLDSDNQIITADTTMSAVDIHKYFHKIKDYAGIRAFNNANIVDISGSDALLFIEQTFRHHDNTFTMPHLNVGAYCLFSHKQAQNPVIIFCYAPQRYCAIIPNSCTFKALEDNLSDEKTDKQVIVNNVSQSWGYVQIIGNGALGIFEKIIKQPIPIDACELWIENIQLRFITHKRFGIDHVDMLIISDAAESFYQKITDDIFQALPFGHTIYTMFALEAGAIFDMSITHKTPIQEDMTKENNFTTPALAMPLVKLDKPLLGGDIYPDKNHTAQAPLGITSEVMIYSPFYNQYVFPTLLRGNLQEWENKIVCVMNKDGQETTQVKIISDKMSKIQEVA